MPPPAEGLATRLFLGPTLRAQPDKRLVTLVREGYETAFEEIVRRYGKPLTRYAAAIVGSRSEDVTQDALSKALLALRRDDAEIELRPWLYRIVRNTALNDLRDNPPPPEALAEAIAGGRNPAEEFEQREELADLMKRLRALPESQRAAIVMRELEGLSHEEIAAALDMSGGAARQAIYRARRALRDGVGMLVPLPLLRYLAETGDGAGAAVAVAAGGGGAAGVKAAIAVVATGAAVTTGVAVHNADRHSPDTASAAVYGRTLDEVQRSHDISAATEEQSSAGRENSDIAGEGPTDRRDGSGSDDSGLSPSHSHRGRDAHGDRSGSEVDRHDPERGEDLESHESGHDERDSNAEGVTSHEDDHLEAADDSSSQEAPSSGEAESNSGESRDYHEGSVFPPETNQSHPEHQEEQ
ncbi:MAG TPA: sigma-70 family RNA polymerase sigma factor [Solirubrobacterales bacterium]